MKITEKERQALLLANTNNRPNAAASYGKAKLSAQDTKELFDRQFNFLADKYNEICDDIGEMPGIQGRISISLLQWEGLLARVTVPDVGEYDAVIFTPATAADKNAMNLAGVFIDPQISNGVVQITATAMPSRPLNLVYFIIRGRG